MIVKEKENVSDEEQSEEFDEKKYWVDELENKFDKDTQSFSEEEAVEEEKEEISDEETEETEEETGDAEENDEETNDEQSEEEGEPEKESDEDKPEQDGKLDDGIGFDESKIDDYVDEYSVKEGITKEASREIIEKDIETAKGFSYDPVKMARSIRSSQSEYGKLQNKIKELEATKEETPEIQISDQGMRTKTAFYKKDDLLDMYKKDYPELTEDLEDDKVWELVKQHTATHIKEDESKRVSQAKLLADDKIDDIVNNLSDKDKEFSKDLKDILRFSDPVIVSKNDFDPVHYLNAIKGQYFDERIKNAREEAYKRGRESVRIKVPSGSSKGHTPSKRKTVSLSSSDQKEALSLFSTLEDQDAFEAYEVIR